MNTNLQELQLQFEQDRRLQAVRKFRHQQQKQRYEMQGGYTSGTVQGRMLLPALLTLMTPKLIKAIDTLPKFTNEERVQAVAVSKLMGAQKMLGIVLKSIVDTCGKHAVLKTQKVLTEAGTRLRTEFYRQTWHEINPDALAAMEFKYRNAGVWHKLAACKVVMGKATGYTVGDLRSEISNISFVHAASWVLDVLNKETLWFENETVRVGHNKTQNFIKLTDRFEQWFNEVGAEIENELLTLYPMICPPRDWDAEGENGGYLKPVDRVAHLMKVEKGVGSTPSHSMVQFVNAMQQTAWEINPFVAEVQEALFHTAGGELGSFKPIQFHPLTNERMPDHIQALSIDHPARVAWRKEKAAINTANAESRRCGIRTVTNMSASRLFKGRTFWVPYAVGHNGRTYVLSAGALSPQGGDAERSLLRFAEGAEMTPRAEYHLALHVANQFGISDSHQAKLDWVNRKVDLITQVALNPLDCLEVLETADEPWQFLAACDEYYHCVIAHDRKTTSLPVSMDATASGLQILALLARDKECAAKVNLIPGIDSKQDIYAALLPLVRKHLKADPRSHKSLNEMFIPRKTLKANLITRVYGSVLRSRRTKIRSTLMEAHNWEIGLLMEDDAAVMASAFEEAMKELAPGALRLFDDLARLGKTCAKSATPARWTTPLGNTVVINPLKNETTRVNLGWFGQLTLADSKKPQYLDTRKIASSLAPTFVHSLDAAILHESYKDWSDPISTVHDCVAVRATEVDQALQSALEGYKTVLRPSEAILNDLNESNNTAIEWQLENTLTDEDIDAITQCEYALC